MRRVGLLVCLFLGACAWMYGGADNTGDVQGEWLFTEGSLDGQPFGNPVTGGIILTVGGEFVTFPIDCNEGSGAVQIDGSSFQVEEIASTAAGCAINTEEAGMFTNAIGQANTIGLQGGRLLIEGEGVDLRFVPLEPPQRLGELPLTAAGEMLALEAPEGRRSSVYTISSPRDDRFGAHPARHVLYVLTAEIPGTDTAAEWRDWAGELEVGPIGEAEPGPDTLLIPDTIPVGDYLLCSPYWVGEAFCFDLPVRPPSAAWFTTAGPEGVVLHDADGTSEVVWDEPATIAFWVEGALVLQTEAGVVVVRDGRVEPLAPAGTRLLDVNVGDGPSSKAVVVNGESTFVMEVDSGETTEVGPAVDEARLHDGLLLVKPGPEVVEGWTLEGDVAWTRPIDRETMLVPAGAGAARLDRFGALYTQGPVFRQFLETEIIDPASGETVESFERELAIPLEGDEITESCIRPELKDGLMLCSQPDGRLVTLQVEFGEMLARPDAFGTTATFARD